MTVQGHMSGHLPGQAPNQGTVPQNNNGNSQMQNLAVPSSAGAGTMVDPDVLKLRRYMLVHVFKILEQRQPSPGDAASKAKYMEVARRLEVGLFKMANSKEEYANESTVESRLARIITGRHLESSNPGHTNSSMIGTMVPTTTGLSHAGGNSSSMVTSSACASVVPMAMDHDILKVREYMRTLVFSELDKRQPCPADDASKAKYLHVARRLEEGLFKTANTREDYLNESTLSSRLATLIRGRKLNNQQNANSSPPGMMTTLAPEVSPETMMVGERVPESEDELETEIAENLKLMSLHS